MKRTILAVLVVLAVTLVAVSCGGGSREASASNFSYALSSDGQGIWITGYSGKGGKVVIPATIEDMPVVGINNNAFQGQKNNEYLAANNITEIVVPASVVAIGWTAFSHNDNLTKVTLSDGIKQISVGAFAYCKKLTSINLPANLESIEAEAFSGCEELVNLTIPDSIQAVKFYRFMDLQNNNLAFQGCGKLPIKTRQTIQGWGYKGSF
jgi:hypothetical protein